MHLLKCVMNFVNQATFCSRFSTNINSRSPLLSITTDFPWRRNSRSQCSFQIPQASDETSPNWDRYMFEISSLVCSQSHQETGFFKSFIVFINETMVHIIFSFCIPSMKSEFRGRITLKRSRNGVLSESSLPLSTVNYEVKPGVKIIEQNKHAKSTGLDRCPNILGARNKFFI